jgi:uncharacterized protein
MHYYLDGYNLMFRILRATEDFRTLREKIIADLSAKIQILDLDVTVVFDATYQRGELDRSRTQSIEILYTAEGETADEFIINELKSGRKPSDHTVVTSDKELAYLARLCHSHTETVEHFISWLNRRYKNKLRRPVSEAPPKPKIMELPKLLKKVELPPPPVESFEYYLQAFEERLKEQNPKLKPEEREYLTDMQRWLRAFEQERK